MLSDYEYSLWGLPEDVNERTRVKHEVHTRSARRLEELCLNNGGIYIKLGQHISQLVGLGSIIYPSLSYLKIQFVLYDHDAQTTYLSQIETSHLGVFGTSRVH